MNTETQDKKRGTETVEKYRQKLDIPEFFKEGLSKEEAKEEFSKLGDYLESNYASKYTDIAPNFTASDENVASFKEQILSGNPISKINKINGSTSRSPERFGGKKSDISFSELTATYYEMMELAKQVRRFASHYPELGHIAQILLDKLDHTREAVSCSKDLIHLNKLDQTDPDSKDTAITEFKRVLIKRINEKMEKVHGKLDESYAREIMNSGNAHNILKGILLFKPELKSEWTQKLEELHEDGYNPDVDAEKMEFFREIVVAEHRKALGDEIYEFLISNLDRDFDSQEHFEIFTKIIQKLNETSDIKFKVEWAEGTTFSVGQTRRVLKVPNKLITGEKLASMVFHEILTHVHRRMQDSTIHSNYLPFEEAIATFSEESYKQKSLKIDGGLPGFWMAMHAVGMPLTEMVKIYQSLSEPNINAYMMDQDFIDKDYDPNEIINPLCRRRTNLAFYDENISDEHVVNEKDKAYAEGRIKLGKLINAAHLSDTELNLPLQSAVRKVLKSVFKGKFDPTHYESALYLYRTGVFGFNEEEWEEYRKFIKQFNLEKRR